MQIHLRSFIRSARTTLLRAEIGGGASLSGLLQAGLFSEMPGQLLSRQDSNLASGYAA
jgi:hypothetical protein